MLCICDLEATGAIRQRPLKRISGRWGCRFYDRLRNENQNEKDKEEELVCSCARAKAVFKCTNYPLEILNDCAISEKIERIENNKTSDSL